MKTLIPNYIFQVDLKKKTTFISSKTYLTILPFFLSIYTSIAHGS